MSQPLKNRVYEILESSDPQDWLSRFDDMSVTVLVLLDVSAFILETSKSLSFQYNLFFSGIELTVLIYFTILYILQLWSCTSDPRYRHPIWGRLGYALTPLVIADLMAILPFYLMALFPDVALIKEADIFRLLRLLKLIRYSQSLQAILQVIANKKHELAMTFLSVLILLIFASSVMYYAESGAQPEAFPSIPAAMWWGVVTLTTVGYGDVYPVTPLGKFFSAALAFIGIGLFALPAGIIASGFSEEIQKRKQNEIPPPAQTQPAKPKLEQQQEIAGHIEQSAELMKLCVETAKIKLGDSFESEEIIRDLAVTLYREAVGKLKEPGLGD